MYDQIHDTAAAIKGRVNTLVVCARHQAETIRLAEADDEPPPLQLSPYPVDHEVPAWEGLSP